jgi:hypothetical protein
VLDDDEDEDYVWVDDAGDQASPITTVMEDRTQKIKFGITSWSHELQAVEVISETKDGKQDVFNFTFKEISESDVKDAKSIEEIVKTIMTDLPKAAAEYSCNAALEEYGQEQFDEYYGTVEDCIESMQEELGKQMDVSQMLGGVTTTALRTAVRS